MDVGIIFCLIFAFGSLILGFTLEGGAISSYAKYFYLLLLS